MPPHPALAPSLAFLFVALALGGCLGGPDGATPTPPTGGPAEPPAIGFEEVVVGLDAPVLATHAGDGSGRLFVVEQAGRVRVVREGALAPEPFLDISARVKSGGEQGLLGLAFHPEYATNGRLFVHYSDREGDTVIARYHASPGDPDRADPATERVLLQVDQPFANHNGGMIAFGPDGYLYVALGDGGSAGDPGNRAQDPDDLLGKMLRLDVDVTERYATPEDNPFAGGGGRAEVWATGLRNPWRFSFDRETGDLWIGDVGQNAVEEVNFQPASSEGGENYGWNVWEGSRRFRPGGTNGEAVFPVAQYARDGHCAVTGGYAYRGDAFPALRGVYVYGDYCSGRVWGLTPQDGAWRVTDLAATEWNISSFGEDEAGEVYVVDRSGSVHRIVPGEA